MKRWTDFTPMDMASLLDDLRGCINDQLENVKRAYANVSSSLVVRPEFQHVIVSDYYKNPPSQRIDLTKRVLGTKIDTSRFKEVMNFKTRLATISCDFSDDEVDISATDIPSDPFSILLGVFTRSDVDALKSKATGIVNSDEIRKGFCDQQYIVKSSSAKYKTVSALANNKLACEKSCFGYDTRKLCTHTIAVAIYKGMLSEYLDSYMINCTLNLTKITTSVVNPNAGSKSAIRKRYRTSSPDVVRSTSSLNITPPTLGDLIQKPNFAAAVCTNLNNSAEKVVKMKITNVSSSLKKPTKPKLIETKSTPFEVIMIKRNIAKCAECGENLKDGPDEITFEYGVVYLAQRKRPCVYC